MLKEILEGINEAKGWQVVKSNVSGANKGVNILQYKDGEDYIEVANQTGNDEYTFAAYWNNGDSDLIDYEYDADTLTSSDFRNRMKDKISTIPKLTKKLLTGLDVLKDQEDDWGTKENR